MSQPIDVKRFTDNPAVNDKDSKFMKLDVKVGPVIASWRVPFLPMNGLILMDILKSHLKWLKK